MNCQDKTHKYCSCPTEPPNTNAGNNTHSNSWNSCGPFGTAVHSAKPGQTLAVAVNGAVYTPVPVTIPPTFDDFKVGDVFVCDYNNIIEGAYIKLDEQSALNLGDILNGEFKEYEYGGYIYHKNDIARCQIIDWFESDINATTQASGPVTIPNQRAVCTCTSLLNGHVNGCPYVETK